MLSTYIKFLFPERVFPKTAFPMDKKREVPQTAITEEKVPQSGEQTDIFDDWPELQRVTQEAGASIETFSEKGWKPFLKNKPNGKQYITLRLQGHDPDTGKHVDTERSLGPFDPKNPERYEALVEMFPGKLPTIAQKSDPPPPPRDSQGNLRASVLTTKVGRIAPIGPSVQIKLGTLQWYAWVQQAAGYPGSLDDFINETVDSYFREHHHLELAVVIQGEEN